MSTSPMLPTLPELPREFLDTTFAPNGGNVIRVNAGDSLQAALDAAHYGDTVVLAAGATFTGNFQMKERPGSGEIHVTSSDLAALPSALHRVSPLDAPHMPRIVTPNVSPALRTTGQAHHWRLVGLEITTTYTASATNVVYSLLKLGDGAPGQVDAALVPHDIVVDRCYVHGITPQASPGIFAPNITQGVFLCSSRSAVIDSYISEIHARGNDAQAILCVNAPGPFKIVNNYLEASGECFLAGGAYIANDALSPTDIEFRRNDCFKPLSWKKGDPSYAGVAWVVKNLFELKNARRVLVEGNTFTNCWLDGQTGEAIAIKVVDQSSTGVNPFSKTCDVAIRHNKIAGCAEGVQLVARDSSSGHADVVAELSRVLIENNLFDGITGQRMFFITTVTGYVDPAGVTHRTLPTDLTIRRNTCVNTNTSIGSAVLFGSANVTTGGEGAARFRFEDNIVGCGKYGIAGSGVAPGNASLAAFAPGAVVRGNAIVGGASLASKLPAGNTYPATFEEAGALPGVGVDRAALELALAGGPPPPPPVDPRDAEIAALTAEVAELRASEAAAVQRMNEAEDAMARLSDELGAASARAAAAEAGLIAADDREAMAAALLRSAVALLGGGPDAG